jgi:hypothetical protein
VGKYSILCYDRLGLNYKIIDCCPNGCIQYRKENQHLRECPVQSCGLSRYISGSTTIPANVIQWFPLIPKLLKMWRSGAISELLMYHTDFPNTNSTIMKSVADSSAWAHMESDVDPTFDEEKWKMRFSLALDGINPFHHNNSQHSTWRILILLYNLPPYLVTKKFFI